jgi:TetR/AcrR family transcriptional repressor of mexCD-oprJ operon
VSKAEAAAERTCAVILDAAARVLSQRPDAAMAEIADQARVGRATLYRHFPTRESLLRGVSDAGIAELAQAIEAANIDELSVDRAIARLTSVFLRTGAKYAAVINQVDQQANSPQKRRVTQPLRDVFARGISEGALRADLTGDLLFELFSALTERALRLTIDETITPEAAADAVVAMFLDGTRRPSR